MRITVFGSTGRTGRHVLAEGLRRGHAITAFTRRPQTLLDQSSLAAVVTGDGRDPDAVRRAVTGADAVLAIVSAERRKGPHHTAAVLEVIIDAMTDLGIRRLVATSAYPIVARTPQLPMALLRRLLASAYADLTRMEHLLTSSELDWTVVRLNRLTDAPARGRTRLSRGELDRPAGLTRADAAATLLDVIADDTTARAALNAAGPRPGGS
ncbi:SDR family oxidoreductase [Dactylosporangium sp. NBC_01737]|uniref:NAD(P)-dependent oxidoreductase n=1 Tax=Dactylosporangium sp. NBC_01737 TaxID=2975959 RepID=UPI002E15D049|nr:SDR family oxidoreductase [Dactylosporangium sp. NBC_01737]